MNGFDPLKLANFEANTAHTYLKHVKDNLKFLTTHEAAGFTSTENTVTFRVLNTK